MPYIVSKPASLESTYSGRRTVLRACSSLARRCSFSGVPDGHSGSHFGQVGAPSSARSAITRSNSRRSKGERTKILRCWLGPHARMSSLYASGFRADTTSPPVIPSYQSIHKIFSNTASERAGNDSWEKSGCFIEGFETSSGRTWCRACRAGRGGSRRRG